MNALLESVNWKSDYLELVLWLGVSQKSKVSLKDGGVAEKRQQLQ